MRARQRRRSSEHLAVGDRARPHRRRRRHRPRDRRAARRRQPLGHRPADRGLRRASTSRGAPAWPRRAPDRRGRAASWPCRPSRARASPAEQDCPRGVAARRRSTTRARALKVELAQQHDELVAAVARERVGGAQLRAPRRGRLLEQLVAGLVATAVVEGLEAVEIEDRHADRLAGEDRLLELRVPGAAVRQAGQHVGQARTRSAVRAGRRARSRTPPRTRAGGRARSCGAGRTPARASRRRGRRPSPRRDARARTARPPAGSRAVDVRRLAGGGGPRSSVPSRCPSSSTAKCAPLRSQAAAQIRSRASARPRQRARAGRPSPPGRVRGRPARRRGCARGRRGSARRARRAPRRPRTRRAIRQLPIG